MFQTSLAQEYAACEQLGFTRAHVKQFVLNAVDASWLPGERKRALRAEIDAAPEWR